MDDDTPTQAELLRRAIAMMTAYSEGTPEGVDLAHDLLARYVEESTGGGVESLAALSIGLMDLCHAILDKHRQETGRQIADVLQAIAREVA